LTPGLECGHPAVPLGGSFQKLDSDDDDDSTTIRVRFSCDSGLYLLGNEVISCDVVSGRWLGEIPVCASDAAKHKQASQSSSNGLAGKAIQPKNIDVTEHKGNILLRHTFLCYTYFDIF
jgi:hypothetical protein